MIDYILGAVLVVLVAALIDARAARHQLAGLREQLHLARSGESHWSASWITLHNAVLRLYMAARWTADRPVDADRLWGEVREVAGFDPSMSPARRCPIDCYSVKRLPTRDNPLAHPRCDCYDLPVPRTGTLGPVVETDSGVQVTPTSDIADAARELHALLHGMVGNGIELKCDADLGPVLAGRLNALRDALA